MIETTQKEGLEYFPFDANFLFDLRTRRLMKIHGPELIYTYVNLLANIYRNKGYYAVCDEELIFITSESTLLDEEKVSGLIRKCVDVGFFDKEKFEQYGILTSGEIQRKFLFATKRRKNVSINMDYLIDKEENTDNETSCIHDVDKNEQSKSLNNKNNFKIKKKEKEARSEPSEQIQVTGQVRNNSTSSAPSWKIDFRKYIGDLADAFKKIMSDKDYLDRKQRFYPEIDIAKSLEKIITEFWGTEKGWERKKQTTNNVIDWRHTFDQQLSNPYNQIKKAP